MSRVDYPEARRGTQVDDYHGTRIADPYRWLEDPDSEETRAWVGAQNTLTRGWLDGVAARAAIRERLAALWDHPRRGVPWRRADRWFQLRNSGLEDQDVLWVMDGPDEQGRVLLDPSTLSDGGTVSLAIIEVSDDGERLAYATSAAGSDWTTWRVRPTDPEATASDDLLEWSKFSTAAWAPDGSGFYYARYDPPAEGSAYTGENRNQRLWFHRLGTAQGDDALIHERPDQPDWGFSPEVTRDGRFLVVQVWQGTDRRTRLWYADLSVVPDPADVVLAPLLDDFDAAYELIGSVGQELLIRTDADAPRGRVIAVEVAHPQRDRWREVVGEQEATLTGAWLCGGRLLACVLDHARHRVVRYHLDGREDGSVELPETIAVDALAGRPEDPLVHLVVTSFTRPPAVYRHDVDTGETSVAWAPDLDLEGVALDGFETEQVFVEADDGARVPMSLVRRADLPHPTAEAPVDVPTLLYGYGGFGISITPTFRPDWLVWLELGGQLAVANLRGGGEYGDAWHDAGRGDRKQRVFDDFVACAQALLDSGWTSTPRLAITGASNGGLLVGACVTQRPELFGACVAQVGVLDMLRFHRFTIGWAWASDYGCADDPEQFATLLAYSPLHNLWPRTAYPATLITTADHDDRVVPAHSFKFAAALQAAQGGEAPCLIRVQTDAGHGAGTPTHVQIDERSDVLAFLVRRLAVDVEEPV